MRLGQQALAALACMAAIAVTAGVCQQLLPAASPLLLASMGASAVILFVLPTSPVARPWAFVGGHWVSALIAYALSLSSDNDLVLLPLATLLSVGCMQLLRCLHPPGTATALAIVLLPPSEPDYVLALTVIALNTALMLIMALLLHRFLLGHHYYPKPAASHTVVAASAIRDQQLQDIIQHRDHMLDISQDELREIVEQVQWQQVSGLQRVYCGDWLRPDTEALSYAQSVDSAWHTLRKLHRQAMPVVDDRQHLIGMLNQEDFLRYLDQPELKGLRKHWRRFIRPTDSLYTDKPEVVGHLMSRHPPSFKADSLISELWPLMLAGHLQLPIVNEQGRLLGMVYWQDVLQQALLIQIGESVEI